LVNSFINVTGLDMNLNKKFLASTMMLCCIQPAYALPDPSLGNPLAKHQITGSLNGASIYQDHENDFTVYVSPPADKDITGGFYLTDGFPDCVDLNRLRKLTYRMPKEDDFSAVISSSQSYSPAFDTTIGIAARQQALIQKVLEAKAEVTNYQAQHADLYGEYTASEDRKKILEALLDAVKKEQRELTENLQNDILALSALSISQLERESLAEEYRKNFAKKADEIASRRSRLQGDYEQVLTTYHDAVSKWTPVERKLSNLVEFEQSINQSFQSLMNISQASFDRSRRLISELESKLIGWGNVNISLAGDEHEKLGAYIAQNNLNYNVSPLPIFNVSTYSGVSKIPSKIDILGTAESSAMKYTANTIWLPSHTMQVVGGKSLTATGFVSGDENKEPVKILMGENVDQPRTISVPVTFGALCGYPRITSRSYKVWSPDLSFSHQVEYSELDFPSPNTEVVNESVVVKYNYYMKAEPLKGSCTLNTGKTDSYLRSAGYEKKWNLFGSSTQSWDNTKRVYTENMGFDCNIDKRPTGATKEEAAAEIARLEKALYDDMFAMFITNFAKEYKIELGKIPEAPEVGKPLATIGSGVLSLCGAVNKYCAITGIVLKTVDELGGRRHNGSTSSVSDYAGTVSRSFNVDSYLVGSGETSVNLKVCLDRENCR
jgi:hypothetical protein